MFVYKNLDRNQGGVCVNNILKKYKYPSLNSESSVSKSLEFETLPVCLLGEFFFFEDSSPEELDDTSPGNQRLQHASRKQNRLL